MLFIRYLLQKRGDPLHVRELCALVDRTPGAPERPERFLEDEPSREDSERHAAGDTSDLDDAELIQTYRKGIQELEAQIKQVELNEDLSRAAQLRSERDDLVAFMGAEFGLDGRPRLKDDPNKKAYDRVSAALRAAKREIGKHHGSFHRHLENFLRYDHYQYTYTPEKPLVWRT